MTRIVISSLLLLVSAGCGLGVVAGGDGMGVEEAELSGTVAIGEALRVIVDAPLREQPTNRSRSLAMVPAGSLVTALATTRSDRFYNVEYQGTVGWIRRNALARIPMPEPIPVPEP